MRSGGKGTAGMGKSGGAFGLSRDSVAAAAVPAFSIDRPSCLLMVSSSIVIEGGAAIMITLV